MFDHKLWPAILVEYFNKLVCNALQRNVCEECLQQYSVDLLFNVLLLSIDFKTCNSSCSERNSLSKKRKGYIFPRVVFI